jgi:putative transposase
MLNLFGFTGRSNNNNKDFQFWKQDYHPITLDTGEKLRQRLNYLHENPVRSGLVWEPWHYRYSSAIDYWTIEKGMLAIEHL